MLRPLATTYPDPKQPRKEFTHESLLGLGESLKQRQIHALVIKPDGTIIDGERRWRAAKLVGITELEVTVIADELTETQVRGIQLASAIHCEDLSAHDKWLACTELLCGNSGWQLQDLAKHLSMSPANITKLMSPSKCIAEIQEALRQQIVTLTDCYHSSRLTPQQQTGFLALKLSGASKEQLEDAAKPTRPSTGKRLSRVRLSLSTGKTVIVSGEEMDTAQLVKTLAAALSAAKEADRDGVDVVTLSRVMAGKSKKQASKQEVIQ